MQQSKPSACLDDGRLIYSSSPVRCYRETQFQRFQNVSQRRVSFPTLFQHFFFFSSSSLKLLYLQNLRQSITDTRWLLDRHHAGAQRESMYKRFPITLDHRLEPPQQSGLRVFSGQDSVLRNPFAVPACKRTLKASDRSSSSLSFSLFLSLFLSYHSLYSCFMHRPSQGLTLYRSSADRSVTRAMETVG